MKSSSATDKPAQEESELHGRNPDGTLEDSPVVNAVIELVARIGILNTSGSAP